MLRLRSKRYRQSEKGKLVVQRRHKLKRHGVTLPEYKEMLVSQNDVCAICGEPETSTHKGTTGTLRELAIDHDHKTNKIRGLLCRKCNIGIALLGEDLDILASATSYLMQNRKAG